MHGTRILTALVALPLLILWIVMGGPFLFLILVCGVGLIAQREYHRIIDARSDRTKDRDARHCARVLLPLVIAASWGGGPFLVGALSLCLVGFTVLGIFRFGDNPELLAPLPWEILGIFWIGIPLSCLGMLRMDPDGVAWVFLTLLLVASGDTGAYYAGRFFGKRKLAPAISPAKTLEGFFGGVGVTIVMAAGFGLFFLPEVSLLPLLATGFVTALIAPLGDLFESMQKRAAGIKDSGNILPGHGGILDRIDALLFAAPVVWCMRSILF